jgi:phosphoribosylanthranilate isomerase
VNAVLKVCGATTGVDVDLLDAAGADLVGLWHGVAGGKAELDGGRLAALAAACHATGTLEPVLVTFLGKPGEIAAVAGRAGIGWLQLHGYQPPGVVAALKKALPEATVVKVLHVQGTTCVERPLVRSYERAGVDLFLLDASDGHQVGSTGLSLGAEVAAELVEATSVPFILAGGISGASRPRYDVLAAHPRFVGIDVDTAARDGAGALCHDSVRDIRRHWPSARVRVRQGAA